jgi:hypothetical protein
MWDDSSMWKALKYVPVNSTARDLLKRLLQPDPKKRIALMRQLSPQQRCTGTPFFPWHRRSNQQYQVPGIFGYFVRLHFLKPCLYQLLSFIIRFVNFVKHSIPKPIETLVGSMNDLAHILNGLMVEKTTTTKDRARDIGLHCITCNAHALLMITQNGIAFGVSAYQVPLGSRTAWGTPLPSVLPISINDIVTTVLSVSEFT